MKNGVIIGAAVLLAACGDPLSGVPRISDVDLAPSDLSAQALPTDAEVAREGFFGTPAATGAVPVQAQAAPARPASGGGFLGMLRRVVPATQPTVKAAEQTPLPIAGTQTDDLIRTASAPDPRASLAPELTRRKRGGFLSRLVQPSGNKAVKPRTGVDAQDVSYGTVLPYGVVARVCDARRKPLGRKIENVGATGYKLFDSNPGAGGVRTYYITGFDDDCPRQLTAAHVLLGDPSLYEQLHYGPAGKHLKFGATDSAYEKVKGRVCGARPGKPCGAKMKQLERNTFFVTSYERLNDNKRWSELLVHDSQVVASALKTN